MRKILFVLLPVFLIQLSLNGQVKKGAIFLGGDINFYADETDMDPSNTYERSVFLISPVVGLAIKDNLVTGIYFHFRRDKITHSTGPTENEQKLNAVGAFIRKYNKLGKSDFSLFFQGQAGIESSKDFVEKNTPTQIEFRHFATMLNFSPGISYSVSRSFQLECGLASLLNLRYSNDKRLTGQPNPVTTSSKSFSFSTSLGSLFNLNLGLRLLLNN